MLSLALDKILIAHATIQNDMQPLLDSLKDRSIPLDERWAAFTALVENNILVNEKNYCDGFLADIFGSNKVSLYDDFHMDRNESRTFVEIWESMNDEFFEGGETYADPMLRDAWREKVMASGFSGFEYDW